MITVKNLTKQYKTPKKGNGILADFLNRQYKTYTAVKNISFEIGEGELIGFIGPNGAGKTTTLKMLSGILYPTSGTIDIFGFTPFEKDYRFLKQIGFIMGQKNQLIWDLPPTDSFAVNKEVYEVPDAEYKKTLNDLVEMLECKDFIDQPVKTLSLGQRMRAEFIAALIHRPKILFLDEPTIGLDIFAQSTIRTFIKEYKEKYNATIILTSHYMQDVQSLADRVLLIDKGSLRFDGPLQTLVERYSQDKTLTIALTRELKTVPEVVKRFDHEYLFPQLKVTVPKKKLGSVLAEILDAVEYSDVSIENEPIESVIKQSFQD